MKIFRLLSPNSYDLRVHERQNARQRFADDSLKSKFVDNTIKGIDESEEILECEDLQNNLI